MKLGEYKQASKIYINTVTKHSEDDYDISMNDVVLAVMAKQRNYEILTNDKKLWFLCDNLIIY